MTHKDNSTPAPWALPGPIAQAVRGGEPVFQIVLAAEDWPALQRTITALRGGYVFCLLPGGRVRVVSDVETPGAFRLGPVTSRDCLSSILRDGGTVGGSWATRRRPS